MSARWHLGLKSGKEDREAANFATLDNVRALAKRPNVAAKVSAIPWLKGEDLEGVMGRGVCEWIAWSLGSVDNVIVEAKHRSRSGEIHSQ